MKNVIENLLFSLHFCENSTYSHIHLNMNFMRKSFFINKSKFPKFKNSFVISTAF